MAASLQPGTQSPNQGAYLQIVQYAAGNALTVGVGAALYGLWSLLSSYQEPLLWAWLVSVALKDTKDWLVSSCAHQLMTRSLPGLLLRTLLFPLLVLKDTIHELGVLLSAAVSEERAMHSRVTSSWRRITSASSHRAGAKQDDWSDDDKRAAGFPPSPLGPGDPPVSVKAASPAGQAAAVGGAAQAAGIMDHAWHVAAVLFKFLHAAFAKAWQHKKPPLTAFQPAAAFTTAIPGSPTLMQPAQPFNALMRSASRRHPAAGLSKASATDNHQPPKLLRSMTTRETRGGQRSGRSHNHHLPHMALATPRSSLRSASYTPWGQSSRAAPWATVSGVLEEETEHMLETEQPENPSHSHMPDAWAASGEQQSHRPAVVEEEEEEEEEKEGGGLGTGGMVVSQSKRLAPCLTVRIPESEGSDHHQELSDGPEARAGGNAGSGGGGGGSSAAQRTQRPGPSRSTTTSDEDGHDGHYTRRDMPRGRRGPPSSRTSDSTSAGVAGRRRRVGAGGARVGSALSGSGASEGSTDGELDLSDVLEDLEEMESRASSRLFVWLFRVAVVQQLILFCLSLELDTLLLWGFLSLAAVSALLLAEDRLDAFIADCKQRVSAWVTANLAPPPPLPKAMSRRASQRMGRSPSLAITATSGSLRRASNGYVAAAINPVLSAASSLERAKVPGGLTTAGPTSRMAKQPPVSDASTPQEGPASKVPAGEEKAAPGVQASSWWADGQVTTTGDHDGGGSSKMHQYDSGLADESSEGQGYVSKRPGKRKNKKKQQGAVSDGGDEGGKTGGNASSGKEGALHKGGKAASVQVVQPKAVTGGQAAQTGSTALTAGQGVVPRGAGQVQKGWWAVEQVSSWGRACLQRSRALRVCVRLFKRVLHAVLMAAWAGVRIAFDGYQQVDVWIRSVLLDNLNELVSGVLVLGTLIGMVIMSAVLLVQIGSEGHDAVMNLDQLLRTRATASSAMSMTNSTSPTMGLLGLFQGQQRQLSLGVEELQLKALSLMHNVLPAVVQHSNDLASKVVAKYNLTPVVEDLEKVYFSLPLSLNCSKSQYEQYTTSVARAELQLQATTDSLDAAKAAVAGNRTRLEMVMSQWEALWLASQRSSQVALGTSRVSPTATQTPAQPRSSPLTWLHSSSSSGTSGSGSSGSSSSSGGGSPGGISKADQAALSKLHAELVDVSSALEAATTQQAECQQAWSDAKEVAGLAERKLRACHALNAADAHNPWSKLLTRCLQLAEMLRHSDMHLIQQEAKVIYNEAHKLFQSVRHRLVSLVPHHPSTTTTATTTTLHTSSIPLSWHTHVVQLVKRAAELLPELSAGLLPSRNTSTQSHSTVGQMTTDGVVQGGDEVVVSQGHARGLQSRDAATCDPAVCQDDIATSPAGSTCASKSDGCASPAAGTPSQPQMGMGSDSSSSSSSSSGGDGGGGGGGGGGGQQGSCPTDDTAAIATSTVQDVVTAGSVMSRGATSAAAVTRDPAGTQPAGVHTADDETVTELSKAAGEVLQLSQDLGVGEGLGDVVGQLAGTALSSISGSLAALAGGTTSLAWDTGAALYQAANSVVTFALDFALFVGTLLYLLTSGEEPLQRLISLLPLSRQHQNMAGRALSQAMRAVFLSSLKLAFFHAGFTWVTLQAAGTHLTTLLTLLSSLLAVLPVLPVWSPVVLPCAELVLARGQYTGAGLLLVTHWLVCAYVDDVIMSEIQPANPYLMGFGVAGGMAVWSNPLKGVLLGPMCLALMSAAYNLHGQLVALEVGT